MFNPELPKVMYTIGGKPMIEHVVNCAKSFGAERIIVIVGHQREKVIAHLHSVDPSIEAAIQAEQFGTGHAVMQAEKNLLDFSGDVVILSGDVPLLKSSTVREMITLHHEMKATVTVLTAILPDPDGYGRIVRDDAAGIRKIVEHKDATDVERKINEINSGIYIFKKTELFDALRRINPNNAQGEYYLTDVFEIFARRKLNMIPFVVNSFDEIRGVNTKEQLDEMEKIYSSLRH